MTVSEAHMYSKRDVRKVLSRSNFYGKLLIVGGPICFMLIVIASILFCNVKSVKASNEQLLAKNEVQEKELEILRAINPYQFNYKQLVEHAALSGDLLPGWITRVYPNPNMVSGQVSKLDIGAFVMDQTVFSLSDHENYGLETPNNPMYRMNGLLPSEKEGRVQIGVVFRFDTESYLRKDKSGRIASCYARVDVDNQRVINQKIRFRPGTEVEKLVTGDILIKSGIHPISATIYCDKESYYLGKDVNVAINIRQPGDVNFNRNKLSIFHMYKQKSA